LGTDLRSVRPVAYPARDDGSPISWTENHNDGWIFELTNCSQLRSVVDLHDFSGRDGANPYGSPVLDANGNLYGTTKHAGTGNCDHGCGVVSEIAP